MKLSAIGDHRKTTDNITISTGRFKILYTIVHAARHNDRKLLTKALKELKAIEIRDFVYGTDQTPQD